MNNFSQLKLSILLIIFAPMSIYNKSLNELLKYNLHHRDISLYCNPQNELQVYEQALRSESNYPGAPISPKAKNSYPILHPTHQAILDTIDKVDISSVCEVGACFGEVSKYIYAHNPSLQLTCVEHNQTHFNEMKEHFETKTWLLEPNIKVKANLIKDSLPHLSTIEDDSFDLVFTCAVMMHIPFIPAVKSTMELTRISKRYILHVENKNEGSDWYNMAVMLPAGMSHQNKIGIDYKGLYESLGVNTILYEEHRHPGCPGTFVVYLGEKKR